MARPEKIKTELGQRLRNIRMSNGNLDREEFSKFLGINSKTLGNYERGDSAPDANTLALYQKLYGVNINWLVTGKGNMLLNDETTSVPINLEQLRAAISAIEEGLNRSKKTINPDAKADLIIIAYNILGEGKSDNLAENVIRLMTAS